MQYGDDINEDAEQSRTAFREIEKKYQLHRERKMRMKRGKLKPGKLVTLPVDISDVIDLLAMQSESMPEGVMRRTVPEYSGQVYTFTRHPGLVVLPGALSPAQQHELTTSALVDYVEPPARTNHVLHYGLVTGLWRASEQGLRLNWGRKDDAHGSRDCGKKSPGGCVNVNTPEEGQSNDLGAAATGGELIEEVVGDMMMSSRSSGRNGGAAVDDGCSSGGDISDSDSHCGNDNNEDSAAAAPSFEECWSTTGVGPSAKKLLLKLRWATLGPQFDWTRRLYDVSSACRQLPTTLEALARKFARIVDGLQGAGLELMPAAGAGSRYTPDAAIINYYQPGDVLGGHLDDVERDMAQPIVSVSLGCPAIFLMGGPVKHVVPTALLLRGGDVLVLAGEARRCYHGVPRILEPEQCSGFSIAEAPAGAGGDSVHSYSECARINISIRAIS